MPNNIQSANDQQNSSGGSNSQFVPPQINLPKGGGAIRGIGEKFTANAVTGTGALSLPIAVSPGRSGFAPQLVLSYDSGSGNGVFGVGWILSLPAISRKTDKGIPQYRDEEESDVFILSGSEDLVPVLHRPEAEEWRRKETECDHFRVNYYRPRIEGLFARIEKWTRKSNGEVHWRSFTRDNILTIYGDGPNSRISDPQQPLHVCKWLISSSYDDKGNAIVYEYSAEDVRGVDLEKPSEQRRGQPCNRYLKRILYGNRKPLPHGSREQEKAGWMFEVVFDFGDEDYRTFQDGEDEERAHFSAEATDRNWPARRDPFSSYRSGFEIRTHRLCRRTLMLHHFPEELGASHCLVRCTEFHYDEKAIGSFLTGVAQSGYTRLQGNVYRKKSLPRLDLGYTQSPLEDEFPGPYELLEAESQNLPAGLSGQNYRWIDLNGEGISGVLTEQGSGWYYKPNLGEGRFGATRLVTGKPASAKLSSPLQHLMDVRGKGEVDLVDLAPGQAGFYERTPNPDGADGLASAWGHFRPFPSLPVTNWNDPNLRFVDVTGDGIADVVITEDVAFRWHPSLQGAGFGSAVRIPAPSDEEKGPRVVFSDPTQSIFLADMSGGGLTDIVRIRNGEVCYWPNLGYGHFGAKVVMDGSPWFDQNDVFDNRRIRLADTDGSSTTDILYLGDEEIHVYLNQSGNSLSPRKSLRGLPAPRTNSISVMDFLGRGTACLVWSSELPADAQRPLRYVDLMLGTKPHLLTRIANNLGAETVVEYVSSTEFYLADKAAGQPWVTPLPFPVHVVKRVQTFDYVSRHRFVSTTSYHHGYYDGVEREFRGFGRVEQMDTEEFGGATGNRVFPAALNEDAAWRVPPVLTKTWFHTGVFLGVDRISRHLADEYYREPGEREQLLEDTVLPSELSADEAREACRALKGSMLRQEIYALDGTEAEDRPYTVAEGNSTLRLLQPRGPNPYCVFFAHAREGVAGNYERKLYKVKEKDELRADPRVAHTLTLEVDDFGNVLKSVSLAYGRRFPDRSELLTPEDHAKQAKLLATVTENSYTNPIDEPENYRTPAPAASRVYELTHLEPRRRDCDDNRLLDLDEVHERIQRASDGRHDLPFEDVEAKGATGLGPYRRLIHSSRSLYRGDALERLLPLGRLETLALPGENYSLALTPGLIAQVYGSKLPNPEQVLPRDGGYVDLDDDGHWWIPSGRISYSAKNNEAPDVELENARAHFFLPRRFRDPFGNVFHVSYDAHDLSPVESRDPVGNVVQAELDYRVLQPRQVTDPNGNRSQAAFDALGMIAGTAVMGKVSEQIGDSLKGFVADLPERAVLEHLRDPLSKPHAILGNATTRLLYDLFAFDRTCHEPQPQPAVTYTMARETHVSDLAAGERTKVQHAFSYSDGFGREVQKKIQAEPGPVLCRKEDSSCAGMTTLARKSQESSDQETPIVDPRWVGSGWIIFNNKGKPVRQYEPFFSSSHQFRIEQQGVSNTLFYDPAERVVATLHPNHTWEKVVFDPWRQTTYDVNDTVLNAGGFTDPKSDEDVRGFFSRLPDSDYLPTWYDQRIALASNDPERIAADKAAVHRQTPAVAHVDAIGRTFLTIARNRFERNNTIVEEEYPTRVELDIEGNYRSVRDGLVQNSDELGRIVTRDDYDMLGNRIHQASMEAGERWMLSDIIGKSIRAWDSRGFTHRHAYDELRRPVELLVTEDGVERLAERTVYGEGQGSSNNHRGRMFQIFDGAGVVTSEAYDFKGNLKSSRRDLLPDYTDDVDWAQDPIANGGTFTSSTTYDALNRATTVTAPDRSIYRPSYNEANFLERVEVHLRGAPTATPFITNIDYDAKGQRTLIQYRNGAATSYEYDDKTFRLISLKTTRLPGLNSMASQIFNSAAVVQDLRYSYDAVGNITRISDKGLLTIFHNGQQVQPACDYTYDAVYRLIEASGREQIGETMFDPVGDLRDYPFAGLGANHPNDLQSLRNYTERFEYDAVGNFEKLIHQAGPNGSWTRAYAYNEPSLIEPVKLSNRLSSTTIGQITESYSYGPLGNMTSMPHLTLMQWDFKGKLRATSKQAVSVGTPETTFYVYDASGQRVRKITERQNGSRKSERIYVGGFEVYREYYGSGAAVTLERQTLHIMGDQQRTALLETKTVENGNLIDTPVPVQRFQIGNHLGSAALELDKDGGLISYEEYHPYGTTAYQTMNGAAEVSLKRYRYTGKERDEETGFYYQGARYYAAWLGRWTSCDPAGGGIPLSSYAYVRNNPLMAVDSTGAWPEWLDKKVAQATATVNATVEVVKEGVGARVEHAKEAVSAAAETVKDKISSAIPDSVKADLQPIASKVSEAAAEVYHSKPAQFVIGFVEAHARAGFAATAEAHKQALGFVLPPYGIYHNVSKGLEFLQSLQMAGQEGGAAGVFVEINRQYNPVFQAVEGAEEAYAAGKGGDWRTAGGGAHKGVVGAVGTVGLALGAFRGGGGAAGPNVTEGFLYEGRTIIVQDAGGEPGAFYQSLKGTGGKQVGQYYQFWGIADPPPPWIEGEGPWVGKFEYQGAPLKVRPDLAGTEVLGPMETGSAAEANAWLAKRGVKLKYDAPPPTKPAKR
jgi:RHS repeat-associated protein